MECEVKFWTEKKNQLLFPPFLKERGMSLEGGVQNLDFGQSYFRKLNTVQLLF